MANPIFIVGGILGGGAIAALTATSGGGQTGIAIGAVVAVVGVVAGLVTGNGSTSSSSTSKDEDNQAADIASDVEDDEDKIAKDEENEGGQDDEIQTALSDGGQNSMFPDQTDELMQLLEEDKKQSQKIAEDAEKVEEIQEKVGNLIEKENQLKMKLQSLTSDYDYMNGNVEKQIENGNVERLMDVLNNQMPDDVEIESFKDLKAQAEDLKEVIQLESEAEEIVKDQIQRLEEQLNELEKMQKRVSNMESREASDTYYDEETEAEVKEMDNLREQLAGRMGPVTQDLKRSKKVLEELEEVKALEQDHYEKVEGILEMEQS